MKQYDMNIIYTDLKDEIIICSLNDGVTRGYKKRSKAGTQKIKDIKTWTEVM